MKKTIKPEGFGKRFSRFLNRADTYELLPEGTWFAGGCWIAAEALRRWVGKGARLMAIYSEGDIPQHVVVETPSGWLLDAGGAYDNEAFLLSDYAYREDVGGADLYLDRFTAKDQKRARRREMICPLGAARELERRIEDEFGEPEDWGLL